MSRKFAGHAFSRLAAVAFAVGSALAGAGMATAATTSAVATRPELEGPRKAMLMFILLAVVLGVFLFLVVVMVVLRRVRRRQPEKARPIVTADPWAEAANRIQPYEKNDRP